MDSEKLTSILKDGVTGVTAVAVELGDAVVHVERGKLRAFFEDIKGRDGLKLNMLLSITAVDWMDERDERFELVYHLRSLVTGAFLRVKVSVDEDTPKVASLVPLWHSARFMEREVWDMFGIEFEDHPDLRRVLMYEEFKGYPLRKDYPVQGKQPRIPLRAPEVRNTAMDMKRSPLMKIGRVNQAGAK